jgi:translation initiation factor 1
MNDFSDIIKNEFTSEAEKKPLNVHIKLQHRNKKKCITFVEGLDLINPDDKDKFINSITKAFKTKFCCGAAIKKPDYVVQLTGDHRENVKNYLIEKKVLKEDQIKMHGY